MNFPPYAIVLAGRELRAGLAGFRILLICLLLGVGAIAAIGSLSAAVDGAIRADSKELLGGDVEARFDYRPATSAEKRFLAASGKVSELVYLRAMASPANGQRHALIELDAVDAAYPLYGRVALSPAQSLARALRRQDGIYGVVADRALFQELHLKPGDRIKIGSETFALRAMIKSAPDQAFAGLIFGPPVIIPKASLAATGLMAPGVIVAYKYRLRLPPGGNPAALIAQAHQRFPKAGWRLRSYTDAAPALRRMLGRVSLYLRLVGLATLLVGAIGIANAVAGHIARKTETIATLKCLGAESRLVFSVYLLQVLGLALAAIAAALAIGALAPAFLLPLFSHLLPIAIHPAFYPAPLIEAALFGLLVTFLFALWPLVGIIRVRPGALFRGIVDTGRPPVPRWAWGMTAAAALALAGLAVGSAAEHRAALYFVAAMVFAFGLFGAAGKAIVAIAERLPHPHAPGLRMALANLHRPGAPTIAVVLSLGLALSMLIAIALVEGNLANEIEARLPKQAPAFFFIDIQPSQLKGFEAAVRSLPDASYREVPMLRGRITRLNGIPADRAVVAPDARWAVGSDRGVTYSAAVPHGSTIVAGHWWPANYKGPPLVSLPADLARGMGLKLGDRITVNILGRDITARLANLRHVEWARLGINFVLVFAPGTLEEAPQTHLAAVYLPPQDEVALLNRVEGRFSNISAIRVRHALDAVDRVLVEIGWAARLVAGLAVAASVLVLGGAISAGQRRRTYEAVVLKVLGATRGAVTRVFLLENAMLGMLAAVVATMFGTFLAYFAVTGLMGMDWVFLPGPIIAVAVFSTILGLVFGFAGTWAALGAKPASFLRGE